MLLIRYKTLLYGTLKTNRQPVNLSLLVFLAYIICIYRLSSIASSLLYTRPHVTAQVVRLARPALLTSSPAVSRLSLFLSLAIISQPRALSLVSLFFFSSSCCCTADSTRLSSAARFPSRAWSGLSSPLPARVSQREGFSRHGEGFVRRCLWLYFLSLIFFWFDFII